MCVHVHCENRPCGQRSKDKFKTKFNSILKHLRKINDSYVRK